VEMAKFTPPKIVKDEEVKEDEKPPEIEKLEDVVIGTKSRKVLKTKALLPQLLKLLVLVKLKLLSKKKITTKYLP
jgi:hypothetical protein